jgi:hypothetical protein
MDDEEREAERPKRRRSSRPAQHSTADWGGRESTSVVVVSGECKCSGGVPLTYASDYAQDRDHEPTKTD